MKEDRDNEAQMLKYFNTTLKDDPQLQIPPKPEPKQPTPNHVRELRDSLEWLKAEGARLGLITNEEKQATLDHFGVLESHAKNEPDKQPEPDKDWDLDK